MKSISNLVATSVALISATVYTGVQSAPACQDNETSTIGTTGNVSIQGSNLELSIDKGIQQRTYACDKFQLNHRVLRYDDKAFIRLKEKITFVNGGGGKLRIPEWDNAEIPFHAGADIKKELLRLFQDEYLKSKSSFNNGARSVSTRWQKMLETFDYESFSQEMAPAVYERGRVVSLSNGHVKIQWEDGGRQQKVPATMSVCFTNGTLRKGDNFGAIVKRGRHNDVVEMHEVSRIPDERGFIEAG